MFKTHRINEDKRNKRKQHLFNWWSCAYGQSNKYHKKTGLIRNAENNQRQETMAGCDRPWSAWTSHLERERVKPVNSSECTTEFHLLSNFPLFFLFNSSNLKYLIANADFFCLCFYCFHNVDYFDWWCTNNIIFNGFLKSKKKNSNGLVEDECKLIAIWI